MKVSSQLFWLIATALVALSFAAPAQAQQRVCVPRSVLVERLSEKYGETTVSRGITNAGAVLEILASEGGAWTVLVSLPNGISCLIAMGRAWENIPRVKKMKGISL